MKITMLAAIAATAIAVPATAHADPTPPPCSTGQVVVTAGPMESGLGHRGVTLIFSLAPGAGPCTLTGYPGSTPAPVAPCFTPSAPCPGIWAGYGRTPRPPSR